MIDTNQVQEPMDCHEEIDAIAVWIAVIEQRLLRAKKSLAQTLRTMTDGDLNCARVYSVSNDIDEAMKAIQGMKV